ncbi:hypothetical protein EHI8A_174130 [Entamoeba histolytica HM-1:IMSS-B]|uniref:Uncharacterized protein n=6 Tax=Entamoeba histolytica TaxID=5759 RepID=C4LWR2_ENTH1|nr:hypothetical protein EHI_198660 [Entamoeba histolytica HM-1:IMSS]EMD45621.1 Hypothetical protein EHI5A_055530 [Entamoeba histolytica KU27]EMH72252.1 hypothetical protein EHI8A_174130 [Entamoeba histolytica HM-1:IMSS-B]EMS15926.1 hypothetical protein KM1_069610 [Entamoeba histolytica HM-3:IMSS]ENY64434.1 hypothetical protein EHI7A_154530 [Entamoeba histolytica HM-1:IMSS-A]GAT93153.1 hypothetical protein CL6EHI_198660 [Entamoeba histolytica]|eukprot:XP_655181.1 hypothetical protein EHI_198660 [Entamoeba histolytica HM-1:IMSS]
MKVITILLFIVLCLADLNVLTREDMVKKQKENAAKKILKSEENIRKIKEQTEKKKRKSKKIVENALSLLTEKERLSIRDIIDSDPEYIRFNSNEKLARFDNKFNSKKTCTSIEKLVKPMLNNVNSTNGTQQNSTQPIQQKQQLKKCQMKHVKHIPRNKCIWKKDKYVYKQPKQKYYALVDNEKQRILCPLPKEKCHPRIIKIDVNKETENAKRAIKLIHKAGKLLKENDIF